jgi:hypothetical protein
MMTVYRGKTFFILFLLITPSLWCEASEWTCGVSAFSGNLEEGSSFLFRQIPLQIYHEISYYPTHILNSEEILFLEEEESNVSREELLEEWDSLLQQRDDLLFDEDADSYTSLTEEIEEARSAYESEITSVEGEYQPRSVSVLTPEDGILFNSVEEALEKEPDLLISGSLNRRGDFVLIDLTVQYGFSDKSTSIWTGAGTTSELDRLVSEMSDALKIVILGREWSALEVTASPTQSQIFLNDMPLGIGAVDEETLEPGTFLLEIRHPRYLVHQEEIELLPGERLVRDITLEAGKEDLITLETVPPGADVILGSVYKGTTPLVLPRLMIPQKLILSLEGFDTLSSDLGPESPDVVSFNLTSGGIDWEQERLKTKDKFYNSMGVFSISVAVPLISYGVWQNYASINSVYMNEAAIAYYGGMALSGALLGVSINRLVKYIKATEKSIEQR